ncbi:hypothetical protein VNO77_08604 [Canavalia gladiata]|uniref:Uncharacterized protein n=1 Tax=Canavalia gladiata TaxID=3824 RepID=A0AAN9ME47_CANGL
MGSQHGSMPATVMPTKSREPFYDSSCHVEALRWVQSETRGKAKLVPEISQKSEPASTSTSCLGFHLFKDLNQRRLLQAYLLPSPRNIIPIPDLIATAYYA